MKKETNPNQRLQTLNEQETNASCPAIIQQDITISQNSPQLINHARSQPSNLYEQQQIQQVTKQEKQHQGQIKFLSTKHKSQQKLIQVKNKGTNFGVDEVQSVEEMVQGSIQSRFSSINRSLNEKRSQQPINKQQSNHIKSPLKHHDPHSLKDFNKDILNVLVAGATDTGKTTFIKCFRKKQRKPDDPHIRSFTRQLNIQIGVRNQYASKRNNVAFVDVKGFESNNQTEYVQQIRIYAARQWQNYNPQTEDDKRIHCCLYFIRGPRLKNQDIQVMKKLSNLFSLIPVIAKSDHYTVQQILEMKQQLHQKCQIETRIQFFDIEQILRLQMNPQRKKKIQQSNFGKFPPFAISTSCQKNFIRQLPFGTVQTDNQKHTDFKKLAYLLSDLLRAQLMVRAFRVQQQVEEIPRQNAPQVNTNRKVCNPSAYYLGGALALFAGYLYYSKFNQSK